MVKPVLPTWEDLGPLPSPRSGTRLDAPNVSAYGRGVAAAGRGAQQLGRSISAAGKKQQAARDKVDDYTNNNDRLKLLAELRAERDAMVDGAQEGAFGLEAGFIQHYTDRVRAFQENAPSKYHQENDAFFLRNEMSLSGPVRTFATNEGNRFYGEEFTNQFAELEKIAAESGDYAQFRKDGQALIDKNPASPTFKANQKAFADFNENVSILEARHIRLKDGREAFNKFVGYSGSGGPTQDGRAIVQYGHKFFQEEGLEDYQAAAIRWWQINWHGPMGFKAAGAVEKVCRQGLAKSKKTTSFCDVGIKKHGTRGLSSPARLTQSRGSRCGVYDV
jgi:hypothetical protein